MASIFSYFPVFVTLLQGQDSIILLLVYVIAYKALRRNAQFAGGMVLALGTIKFTLLLPFLIPFVVKKGVRVLLGFALALLLLAGVSIATVGVSTAAYYPRFLLSIDRLAKGVNVPQDMPNLRGLLSVFPGSKVSPVIGLLLLAVGSVLLLVFAARKWRTERDRRVFDLGISLNLVVTVLVSYHCHSFDLSLLLLPMSLVLGLLLSNENLTPRTRKLLMSALGTIAFSPLYILFAFVLNYPSLISLLLLTFAFAIGVAISGLEQRSISQRMSAGLADS